MSLLLLNPVFQAAVDTVATVATRDTLQVAVDVAVLLMAVGVFLLALLAARVLARVNRTLGRVQREVGQRLGPVADRAGAISDNVEFITDAVRTDIQRLNASIKALSERLHQASDHMEERVEEFNALMELVQSEAEEIFLDTAATVRGVREGARTMASGDGGRGADGPLRVPGRGTDGPEGPSREPDGPPGFVPGQDPDSHAPTAHEEGEGEPGSEETVPGAGSSEGSPSTPAGR